MTKSQLLNKLSPALRQYLQANAKGSADGAKRCTLHWEIAKALTSYVLGRPVMILDFLLLKAVKSVTLSVTDNLDKIGFPVDRPPQSYAELVEALFNALYALKNDMIAELERTNRESIARGLPDRLKVELDVSGEKEYEPPRF